MAIINQDGLAVWYLPEDSERAIPIARKIGKDGYPGKIDGIAIPSVHPGKVFKVVNGFDIEILPGGKIKLIPNEDWSLLSDAGQLAKGGWFSKPTKKMGKRWNDLFKRAKGAQKKKPPKPAGRPNVTSSEPEPRNRRYSRRSGLGVPIRSSGGGGFWRGTVTIIDLN